MIIVLNPNYKVYIDFIIKEEDIKTPLFLFMDNKYLLGVKNAKRRNEIISTHYLLYNILKAKSNILYNKNGKPYLENKPIQLSISHSTQRIAVGFSSKEIGIDIQEISDKLKKVYPKFVNANDVKIVGESLDALALLWSAKEAVYKIDNNQANFLNLRVTKIVKQNKFRGQLFINDMWIVDYFFFDYYYLTVAKNK